jgi:hypothetical protein
MHVRNSEFHLEYFKAETFVPNYTKANSVILRRSTYNPILEILIFNTSNQLMCRWGEVTLLDEIE